MQADSGSTVPVRLNLGAGSSPIEGYDNSWDVKQGKQAYPLALQDKVADEIRVSHLLEHFNHRGAHRVVADWVRVLKPGGLLKIAVPDLEAIARKYLAGEPGQYQGWLSGGQVDPYDVHLAQYDWNSLCALLRQCGVTGLHRWQGHDDCSQLDISLNVAGWRQPEAFPKTIAVMSRPRLGFMDQFGCAMESLMPLGIPVYARTGVYWGKCLTMAIDAAIGDGTEWVLALDYDTLFTISEVQDMLMFMHQNQQADALVPVQMHRMNDMPLLNPRNGATVTSDELEETYLQIRTGHFGCSLFRASVFKQLKKPWFVPTYKETGETQYDEDINFWLSFEKAGFKAFLAPRVAVGHLEAMVMWPDRRMTMLYQKTNDWRENGKPRGAWR